MYCPLGHVLSHMVASKFLKKPDPQLEQFEFVGPLQEAQAGWQFSHLDISLIFWGKYPTGQFAKHWLLIRYRGNYDELIQFVQLVAEYMQVRQGYWQYSHWLVEFLPYCRSGHTDVHIVCEITKKKDDLHLVHDWLSELKHIEQEISQAAHNWVLFLLFFIE